MTEATLVISHWYSTCSACGRGADPMEATHEKRLGYGDQGDGKGCGARFVAVRPEYTGEAEAVAVGRLRPDLPLVGAAFESNYPARSSSKVETGVEK